MPRKMGRSPALILHLVAGAVLASGVSTGWTQTPQVREAPANSLQPIATATFSARGPAADVPRVVVPGGTMLGEETPGLVGAPFSAVATKETVTTFVDGNRVVQTEKMRFFRDSQGRFRSERSLFVPSAAGGSQINEHTRVSISDPVRGEAYWLSDSDKSVQVMPRMFAGAPTQGPVEPPVPYMQLQIGHIGHGFPPDEDSAAKTVSLGEKTIEGVRVVGSRLERTIPVGYAQNERPITVSAEQWFSRELGVIVLHILRSSIGTQTTYRLQQIVQSEPDPSLFTVPPGYTRREARSLMMPLENARKP